MVCVIIVNVEMRYPKGCFIETNLCFFGKGIGTEFIGEKEVLPESSYLCHCEKGTVCVQGRYNTSTRKDISRISAAAGMTVG